MNLYDEVLLIYEAHDKSVSEGVPNGILKVKKLSNSINWDALYNIKKNFNQKTFHKATDDNNRQYDSFFSET